MEVELPGGLPRNGHIERKAIFQPLTGRLEQRLIEFDKDQGRPGYVTALLCSALNCIGDEPADSEQVSQLCVADRQFLMLRLAAMLGGEQMWLKVGCCHCDSPFDVELKRCDLPIKPAGRGFPLAKLQLNGHEIEARVPTGEDQERIDDLSEEEAMGRLLQNCIISVSGEAPSTTFTEELSEAEIEAIDEALDEVSPAVCNQLLVICPECGREQYANLDHYTQSALNEHSLYDEVHTLASHYHWSEREILDLPRYQRRRYLRLINRVTGVSEGR